MIVNKFDNRSRVGGGWEWGCTHVGRRVGLGGTTGASLVNKLPFPMDRHDWKRYIPAVTKLLYLIIFNCWNNSCFSWTRLRTAEPAEAVSTKFHNPCKIQPHLCPLDFLFFLTIISAVMIRKFFTLMDSVYVEVPIKYRLQCQLFSILFCFDYLEINTMNFVWPFYRKSSLSAWIVLWDYYYLTLMVLWKQSTVLLCPSKWNTQCKKKLFWSFRAGIKINFVLVDNQRKSVINKIDHR